MEEKLSYTGINRSQVNMTGALTDLRIRYADNEKMKSRLHSSENCRAAGFLKPPGMLTHASDRCQTGRTG